LHYVEEYSTEEIAKIIGKTASAVKMRLKKGRSLLEEKYRKEYM
ncbi:MAG: RNA polymerase sigma factor, partial [Firmicutes bacterium]|nr:RNA polymerase sigma factor [Bacillota bacterium]